MWRPGFPYLRQTLGMVDGLNRSLCVYSYVHRGTPQRPGLVLGLDHGGQCRGAVFEIADEHRTDVLAYLRAREQATMVYIEETLPVQLDDGRTVNALTYCIDRSHEQYAGELSIEATVRQVVGSVGQSGRNEDYVISTADHLNEAGIHDERLLAVAERLRAR